MATSQSITSGLRELADSAEWRAKVDDMRKRAEVANVVLQDPDPTVEEEIDYASLMGLMLTTINGTGDVQEQRVRVQYLSHDRFLYIPAHLAVHPTVPTLSEANADATLVSNLRRAITMTYTEIANLVDEDTSMAEKRAKFAAIAEGDLGEFPRRWAEPSYYQNAAGDEEPQHLSDLVFAAFSKVIRLNCDVRDVGFLVMDQDNSRLTDDAWRNAELVTHRSLRVRCRPYTTEVMAALNLPPCDSFNIGAWVRSFGVACGVLPKLGTRLNTEWKFTKASPSTASIEIVRRAHDLVGSPLATLCLNIIGMFGLFHLNKNHTFKTGDSAMDRVCTSYVQTLRTMVSGAVMDELKANMEVVCRTAAHPFGLGQTYFVAHALNGQGALATPLAIRLDVCPPLVQRLLIVEAATREWTGYPIGETLNHLFTVQISTIRREIARIRTSPPSFSELAPIYGLEAMQLMNDEAKKAADSLMPLVCGYAQATHTDTNQKKDGLALAMSFQNVLRDYRSATNAFQTLWSSYMDTIDRDGLEAFIKKSFDIVVAPQPAPQL